MATTVPDGIWTPDDSTAYNLPVDLAAMADTVQTGLNNVRGEITSQNQQFYGPAAGRTALTGVKPGDTYQETDAGKLTWRQLASGAWRVFNTNGPIALTLASGWTASQAVTFEVRSGLLVFNGRAGASSAAGATMATLPVDYRPSAPRVMNFTDVSTLKDLIVGTDGTITQFGKGATVTTDMRLATIAPFPIG